MEQMWNHLKKVLVEKLIPVEMWSIVSFPTLKYLFNYIIKYIYFYLCLFLTMILILLIDLLCTYRQKLADVEGKKILHLK